MSFHPCHTYLSHFYCVCKVVIIIIIITFWRFDMEEMFILFNALHNVRLHNWKKKDVKKSMYIIMCFWAYHVLFATKCSFSSATSISVRKRLYLSLVLPIVTYGSPVWWPPGVKDFVNFEKLQKRATKFIIGMTTSLV